MAKKIIQTGCLILATLYFQNTRGQDATAGLYVCIGNDGMRNIVNKPTGDHCKPYRKDMLRQKPSPKPSSPQRPKQSPPSKTTAAKKTVRPVAVQPQITADTLTSQAKAKSNLQKKPVTPVKQVDTLPALFPPAPGFTGNGSNEMYRLFGIMPTSVIAPPEEKTIRTPVLAKSESAPAGEKKIPPPSLKPTEKSADHANQTAQIWVCARADGTPAIVESDEPLQDCQPLGKKAAVADKAARSPAPLPNRGKPLVGGKLEKGDGAIALTDSPPQDIYKCFDKQGQPNYVGANQRAQFRHCRFFSRSFAGAHNEFIRETTRAKKDLVALAAAGVQQKDQNHDGPGLHCIGEGSITFNGENRHFNCATRSFDYTPGTSGGNIRLGNQQASVAAHSLDYMNTRGSCGGTITSENGRVFHLSPTKDCPQAFIIRARRILSQIEKQLNIPTSGAFRQRQRTLAAQINQIARQIGIDPYLVHAIISAESAYKYRAVSHAGARGLMQLMPATARRFGVSDSFHTGENIRGGATYLKWLLDYFNGDMTLAIAGYNAGEGNVRKYGNKIPPFIETRAYVPKVMQYYRHYRNHPSEIGL